MKCLVYNFEHWHQLGSSINTRVYPMLSFLHDVNVQRYILGDEIWCCEEGLGRFRNLGDFDGFRKGDRLLLNREHSKVRSSRVSALWNSVPQSRGIRIPPQMTLFLIQLHTILLRHSIYRWSTWGVWGAFFSPPTNFKVSSIAKIHAPSLQTS